MVKLVAFPRGNLRSINLNVFHSISSSNVSYRSGLSSAGVLMSEVIVPLIKRGGQVEKKSAQVLTLGGDEGGQQQGQQREDGERYYRRRIGSSSKSWEGSRPRWMMRS